MRAGYTVAAEYDDAGRPIPRFFAAQTKSQAAQTKSQASQTKVTGSPDRRRQSRSVPRGCAWAWPPGGGVLAVASWTTEAAVSPVGAEAETGQRCPREQRTLDHRERGQGTICCGPRSS